jgi:hypothetical protein
MFQFCLTISLKYIIRNTTPQVRFIEGNIAMESFAFEIPKEMIWQARAAGTQPRWSIEMAQEELG